MRVLRIITRLNVGGPSFHVRHLARDLPALGAESLVVHGTPEPGEGDLSPLLDQDGSPREHVAELGRGPRAFRDLRAYRALDRIVRRFRPDVVHTHLAKAGALGRIVASRRKVPVVVHTFHGHVFRGYFPSAVSAGLLRIERGLARRTDRLVVPGTRVRDELLELQLTSPDKIVTVPQAVDWKGLDTETATDPIPARPSDRPVVACIGRLVPIKGQAKLLEAIAILAKKLGDRAPIVWLAGEGPCRQELESLARELGIEDSVHLIGRVSNRLGLYRSVDLVALPSRNEGVPLVVLEARGCGVPVIASNVGGVADAAGNSSSVTLVPPDDPTALADAIEGTLTNLGRLQDDAREGAEAARRAHDPDRVARQLSDLYRDLLDRRSRGERR